MVVVVGAAWCFGEFSQNHPGHSGLLLVVIAEGSSRAGPSLAVGPGIMEWFGLGGTFKSISSHPCHGQGHLGCPRLLQALPLDTSRDIQQLDVLAALAAIPKAPAQ